MAPRRRPDLPVGIGDPSIPYDRSGMSSSGMSGIPSPSGAMRKMSLEFTDPNQQGSAAPPQPQIPQGAGVPPQGMQAPIPPAGMQPPQMGGASPLLAGLGQDPNQQGGMPQPGMGAPDGMGAMGGMPQDSSMLGNDQLASMAQGGFDPNEQLAEGMFNQSIDPQNPEAQMLQQQLLLAARRQLQGGGGF